MSQSYCKIHIVLGQLKHQWEPSKVIYFETPG